MFYRCNLPPPFFRVIMLLFVRSLEIGVVDFPRLIHLLMIA